MNRWYRQVLPQPDHIFVFGAIIALLDLTTAAIWLAWGKWLVAAGATSVVRVLLTASQALCGMAAVFLALMRICQFPVFNAPYRKWLSTTPWTPERRLPFGPWRPVIQDVVPMGILGLVSAVHGAFAFGLPPDQVAQLSATMFTTDWWMLVAGAFLLPSIVFVGAWACLGYVTTMVGWKRSGYVPALVLGLLIHVGIRLSKPLAIVLGATLVIVGFALVWWKMKRLLNELPQTLYANDAVLIAGKNLTVFRFLSPQGYQNPAVTFMEETRPRAVEFGVLLYVWLSVVPWVPEFVAIAAGFVSLAALIRVAIFAHPANTHLGLLGRWRSRRLFVWEYDRIWLPSLVMIAMSIGFAVLFVARIFPASMICPLVVVVPLLIGWISGPDYRQWSLTAPVHYVARQRQ